MKERDYVRIKNKAGWCCIGKICNINEFREYKYCVDIDGDDFVFIDDEMIEMSDPNILKVLKEGDFVEIEYLREKNRRRIKRVFEVDIILNDDNKTSISFSNGHTSLDYINNSWSRIDKRLNPKIISVFTREQFDEGKFRVE